MEKSQRHHILLITFPVQGHMNPTLQLAKRLIRMGIEVTFATTTFAHHHMSKSTRMLQGLNLISFSDGSDDGYKFGGGKKYVEEFKNRASNTLRDTIIKSGDQGKPITTLVYTLLLPFAAKVAQEFQIPSALFWIQPAIVFDIYHYYFNGHEDEITNNCNNPNWSIQFPGLPLLTRRDLPSFILSPRDQYSVLLMKTYKEQLDVIGVETSPTILINTFDALEPEALKAIEKYRLIAVGPLIPSAFLDGQDPLDTSYGGDLYEAPKDYTEWLNSKPESSVVYVSFGSLLSPKKDQTEEIAKGLLKTGRPFLWAMRMNKNNEEQEDDKMIISCIQDLEQNGMIVPWCSQLEVLSHPSVGCFVTHCGWNSTLESVACGVPVVAFPQWADQGTNAKMIQDVWKTGVRLTSNEDGMVSGDEIKRGIDLVMDGGPVGLELRKNARKWKKLAREANQEGGSSYLNLKSWIEENGNDNISV